MNPLETGGTSTADAPMLIDRYLPAYDVSTVRHATVDAAPETTYMAMLDADLLDTGPVVRALSRLRDLPAALSDRMGGEPRAPPPERLRFADVPSSAEWTLLDEAPGEEYVFGAVGTFWRPAIEWRSVDPDGFAAFDEPGYAKLAVGLSVRPFGEGRTLLSYEARTATTDAHARRKFRRYWRVVGPFAGYLMTRALDRVRADAEAGADAAAGAGRAPAGTRANRTPTPRSHEGVREREPPTRSGRRLLAGAGLALAAAYHFVVRPWHRTWGTTAWEARAPLPGDELLPDATRQVTHGIEIDASPGAVWQWLVQIGQGRGGFYSYDWLESAVGADIHNVDRIVPELQDLSEGDVVRLAPQDYPISSPESAPEVVRLDPERALVLRPPGASPAWTWAFVLEPVDGGTRLLARTRSNPRRSSLGPLRGFPRLLGAVDYLFWEPAHFVMERRMLKGIKRRAEGTGALDSTAGA